MSEASDNATHRRSTSRNCARVRAFVADAVARVHDASGNPTKKLPCVFVMAQGSTWLDSYLQEVDVGQNIHDIRGAPEGNDNSPATTVAPHGRLIFKRGRRDVGKSICRLVQKSRSLPRQTTKSLDRRDSTTICRRC
eukprot:scaffold134689_cov27-Tisochrysis_lutea.AAC.2